MLAQSGPNWLGSPQHVAVGAILALIVYCLARWRPLRLPAGASYVLAIGVVGTAEIVFEVIEYATMYADKFHYSAYYDTLADMAGSVVGAIVGAAVAIPLARQFANRS